MDPDDFQQSTDGVWTQREPADIMLGDIFEHSRSGYQMACSAITKTIATDGSHLLVIELMPTSQMP